MGDATLALIPESGLEDPAVMTSAAAHVYIASGPEGLWQ
jgi:hypothetical protein